MSNPFGEVQDQDNRRERERQALHHQSELFEKYTDFVVRALTQLRDVAYQGHEVRAFPPAAWAIWDGLPMVDVELLVDPSNLSDQFECKAFFDEAEDHKQVVVCPTRQDDLIRTLKTRHYRKK